MAASLVKGLARFTVVGGVVYLTVREGIWGDSSQATQVLSKVKMDLVDTNVYRKQLRPSNQSFRSLRDVWNNGVQFTCEHIADSPTTIRHWTSNSLAYIQNSLGAGK